MVRLICNLAEMHMATFYKASKNELDLSKKT